MWLLQNGKQLLPASKYNSSPKFMLVVFSCFSVCPFISSDSHKPFSFPFCVKGYSGIANIFSLHLRSLLRKNFGPSFARAKPSALSKVTFKCCGMPVVKPFTICHHADGSLALESGYGRLLVITICFLPLFLKIINGLALILYMVSFSLKKN